MKYIQLGIDYGTSAAKMIFRDFQAAGGERSYLIDDANGGYRISTSVFYDRKDTKLYFCENPAFVPGMAIGYHSIKMRVAEEMKAGKSTYFYGERISFPEGIEASDLAIITVWCLAEQARTKIIEFFKINKADLRLSMTMGIPMSFYNDLDLRQGFLSVIRCAAWLVKNKSFKGGCLTQEEVAQYAKMAKLAVSKLPSPSEESVRDWIRTEAESALLWAFSSPMVKEGLYAKADIGAGTTNASIFRITEQYDTISKKWQKKGMAFFGAHSDTAGMDSIDEILKQHAFNDCKEKEEDVFQTEPKAKGLCNDAITRMHVAVQTAWSMAYQKQRDVQAWKKMDIFVFGGGSQVSIIRDQMKVHPYPNAMHWERNERTIKIHDLDMPHDLKRLSGNKFGKQELPFLLVAYGLSNNRLSVQEVKTPGEIKEIPPPLRIERPFRDFEEL